MLVEIRGCSRRNKGAELMLIAIQEHFRAANADVRFAVDHWFGAYLDRALYGLWVRPALKRNGRASLGLYLMPALLKNNLGIVELAQVDGVVDAAGFAYGDIHGAEPTEALARAVIQFKKQRDRPFILLPQAFGPFTTSRIRQAIRQVADKADRIYARDARSFESLIEVCGSRENIRLAPDFTALVEVESLVKDAESNVLVIPNSRMLDKSDPVTAQGYQPFLVNLIRRLQKQGFRIRILLHDRDEDQTIAAQINTMLQTPLTVISAEDPRRLKALIGQAHFVVGSRFHSLVGALSQAVPAIGIGWSHKYEELFNDYECSECLLSVDADDKIVDAAFNRVIAESAMLRELLVKWADRQKTLIDEMWVDVDDILGIK